MVQRQVFLKEGRGGGGLVLFLFNFFKVYHFYIQELLYPLKNCVMHDDDDDDDDDDDELFSWYG